MPTPPMKGTPRKSISHVPKPPRSVPSPTEHTPPHGPTAPTPLQCAPAHGTPTTLTGLERMGGEQRGAAGLARGEGPSSPMPAQGCLLRPPCRAVHPQLQPSRGGGDTGAPAAALPVLPSRAPPGRAGERSDNTPRHPRPPACSPPCSLGGGGTRGQGGAGATLSHPGQTDGQRQTGRQCLWGRSSPSACTNRSPLGGGTAGGGHRGRGAGPVQPAWCSPCLAAAAAWLPASGGTRVPPHAAASCPTHPPALAPTPLPPASPAQHRAPGPTSVGAGMVQGHECGHSRGMSL